MAEFAQGWRGNGSDYSVDQQVVMCEAKLDTLNNFLTLTELKLKNQRSKQNQGDGHLNLSLAYCKAMGINESLEKSITVLFKDKQLVK